MPQKGDRYIIEIEEVCPAMLNDGSDALYRIKGFRSLVFDKYGLNMLKTLEPALADAYRNGYEAAFDDGVRAGKLATEGNSYAEGFADGKKAFHEYDYQNGLDMAWAAVKILIGIDSRKEYNHAFAGLTAKEIIQQFPPDEVVSRLKAQLDSTFLCTGDEVEIGGKKVVVTRVPEDDPGRFCYIDSEGRTYANNAYEAFKKTGRHFPIEDLLKQMEGNNE